MLYSLMTTSLKSILFFFWEEQDVSEQDEEVLRMERLFDNFLMSDGRGVGRSNPTMILSLCSNLLTSPILDDVGGKGPADLAAASSILATKKCLLIEESSSKLELGSRGSQLDFSSCSVPDSRSDSDSPASDSSR
mmetsp:Transcript_9829/g.13173  ORF Transcript_9829/g.13173 Transcript_9829/m.13173 type:complete len:135 (+) Transcript_9829:591-995(+)